jgi:beta-glucosidase
MYFNYNVRLNPDGSPTGAFVRDDFPENFYWGTAVAAHQVEGNNSNDWTRWELSINRLRKLVSQKKSLKDHVSGHAVNFYEDYESFLELVKQWKHNAFRFSIEWSRIEPAKGLYNDMAMQHYIKMVDTCNAYGLEPFVTLWHYTHPDWFADEGYWNNPKSVDSYLRYVEYVAKNLKGKVKFLISFNEPNVWGMMSQVFGFWPPEKHNLLTFNKSIKNMISAHRQAHDLVKGIDSSFQFGMVQNFVWNRMSGINPIHLIEKKILDWYFDLWFLEDVKDKIDFVGLNYYFWNPIGLPMALRKAIPNSLMDNSILGDGIAMVSENDLVPEGLYQCIKTASKFKKPIYITEHGCADPKNELRPWYIRESLDWVKKAIEDGYDVRSYLHWSLMDNYEWAHGYDPKFGLLETVR